MVLCERAKRFRGAAMHVDMVAASEAHLHRSIWQLAAAGGPLVAWMATEGSHR